MIFQGINEAILQVARADQCNFVVFTEDRIFVLCKTMALKCYLSESDTMDNAPSER